MIAEVCNGTRICSQSEFAAYVFLRWGDAEEVKMELSLVMRFHHNGKRCQGDAKSQCLQSSDQAIDQPVPDRSVSTSSGTGRRPVNQPARPPRVNPTVFGTGVTQPKWSAKRSWYYHLAMDTPLLTVTAPQCQIAMILYSSYH